MAIACPGCLHCLRVKGLPEDLPVYDIGQSLPFDVPSQLGRAEALVASFGSLEGQRILVVGGGAAGVGAAIAALNADVASVLIVEQATRPVGGSAYDALFNALRSPRDLDGGVYSWPNPVPTPLVTGSLLPFKPGPGFAVAAAWVHRLRQHPRLDRLRVLDSIVLENPESTLTPRLACDGRGVHLVLSQGEERFDAVIIATLNRVEERKVGSFMGFGFWEKTDPITSAIADGLRPWVNGTRRVLVSGGGNGGQQDFIQAICGLCVRDVLAALALPDEVVKAAQSVHRGHVARGAAAEDISREWRNFANDVFNADPLLQDRLRTLVGDRWAHVRLQHRGAEFGRSFALNQLLTRLIACAGGGTVQSQTELEEVKCVGACSVSGATAAAIAHVPDPPQPHIVVPGDPREQWHLVYVRHRVELVPWWRPIVGGH